MNEESKFENVLLLEDDAAHALLIRRALKGTVLNTKHCLTFSEAKSLLSEGDFDLIIADLNLPDATNLEHIDALSKHPKGAPVVVLTSSTSLQDAVEAMRLGARDFVVKDFGAGFSQALGLALSRLAAAVALEREHREFQRKVFLLQRALDNSRDAFAVVDGRGGIVYANSAFNIFAERCSGDPHSLQALFGTPVHKSEALRDTLVEKLQALQADAFWHTEVTFTDQRESAFDLSLSIVGEGDKTRTGVVWIRDISEQKQRERFQREILSTTTHDLKGPLGAILISSDLASELVQDQQRAHALVTRINSAARGAVNLIDEFLSARRIQEGAFVLKPEQADVRKIIHEIVDDYRTMAAARSVDMTVKVEGDPLIVKLDKLGLMRVLGNLISNAIKFTPPGGCVEVRACLRSGELQIEVSDSGCGMEAAEAQRIFDRFSRLAKHAEVAGSGIGLFVVKSIVAAHGGTIEVTSAVNEGSTFRVAFPLEPPVNERGELIALDFTSPISGRS